MTDRSLTHSSLNLERAYIAPPAAVFAAWTNLDALKQWAIPVDGWTAEYEAFEPIPGGREISTFTSPDGQVLRNEGTYGDIVPDERLVSLYTMASNGTRIFSGLLSVEFNPSDGGCRLQLSEQGVFYDGHDAPENHKLGYQSMLLALSAYLQP